MLREDLLTWDKVRQRAREHDDLADNKKAEALVAYDALENIFGTAFLDTEHPLFGFFADRSGWRHEWAVWFAKLLQSLEKHPDFQTLTHKLKHPDFFGERMTVLKIAELLSLVGFEFRFDSPTRINGVQKEPDLFVRVDATDPGFFIEVSRMGPSEKQLEADEAFNKLFDVHFLWPLDRCCGHLERVPAPLHLQELKTKIEFLMRKVHEENGFECLEVPGLIRFACAGESRMDELHNWAKTRGLKVAQLSGPGVNVDEFDRISRKLKDKIGQVPQDRANVIVLYPYLFSQPPRETAEFSEFVHALEDIVYRHPHVGYLVVILRWMGGNENTILKYRDHICVNRRWLYFNCSSMMLIRNRFAAKPMPEAAEKRFLDAFMTMPIVE